VRRIAVLDLAFSSNATIDLLPKGKRLLLEADMDKEEFSSADGTGPPPSVRRTGFVAEWLDQSL
jgi:hypothetical protein